MIHGRNLVILPTYNEFENLPLITGRLRVAVPTADILVVDDNSPDGTGELADRLRAADGQIHVLHRPAKQGFAAAYLAGFGWALTQGYDVVVQMDADGSHRPEELPGLLERLDSGADVVLGSRWAPGGGVVNWPRRRILLSRAGNAYARIALRLNLHDVTSGFRAYRAAALARLDLATITSAGYCLQIELTFRAVRAALRMVEVPITFIEREHGQSKMSRAIMVEWFQRVTGWAIQLRRGSPLPAGAPLPDASSGQVATRSPI